MYTYQSPVALAERHGMVLGSCPALVVADPTGME